MINQKIEDPFFAYMSDSLHNTLVRLSSNDLQEMPVLSSEDHKVIGIVTIADLVELYDKEVEKIMRTRDQNGLSIDINNTSIEKNKDHHITDKRTSWQYMISVIIEPPKIY